jgi:ankyrin repeat protein
LKGLTPAHHAAKEGHYKFIEALEVLEVDLNIKDISGKTPLILASIAGERDACRVLLTGSDSTIKDNDGLTAFLHCCILGKTEAAKMLVKSGVSTNDRDPSGKTGLQIAEEEGMRSVVEYLLSHERFVVKRP